MQRFLGIILFFIFVVGCKSDRPANIIKEKEMTNLLLDLHLAEGYTYSWAGDSSLIQSANSIAGIYEHYHTDSVTVRESLEYYAAHPQILYDIYKEVDKRLKEMETNVRDLEQKKYREIYVRDSIRNAFVADSLQIIKTDSMRYADHRYMLYWKDSDSIALKPKVWDWKKENLPSRKYFNYTDSLFLIDSTSIQDSLSRKDSISKKDGVDNKKDTVLKKAKSLTKKKALSKKTVNPAFQEISIDRLKSTTQESTK